MPYLVEIESRARKEFLDLPGNVQQDLIPLIDTLQQNPPPFGCKKLKGINGYRLRKGKYRILYTVDDERKTVRVYRLGHRRDVY